MAVKAEFDVPIDSMVFSTKTNGDRIEIGPHNGTSVHLGQEAATNLANLVNSGQILNVVIKAKV